MSIGLDGSTPVRWTGTPADGVNMTSAAFTAPADALLVVAVQGDSNGPYTITVSDSGGLTWNRRVERDSAEATAGGYAGWFTARTTSSVSRTISVSRDQNGGTNRLSAKARVLTGVDVNGTPVDTVSASNEGGSGTNNLTTTSVTPGGTGWLLATSCDWNALGFFEASSDLTQDTDTYAGTISVCDGYKNCTSGVGVTANLNAAGSGTPQHKWCQIVIREAASSLTAAQQIGIFDQQRSGCLIGRVDA